MINSLAAQEIKLTNLLLEEEIEVPESIKHRFEDSILRVASIDFTGDYIDDYIVWVQTDSLKNEDVGFTFEYFLKSDLKIWAKRIIYYQVGIFQRKFVNFDFDRELEIINLSGYEDGVDSYVFDYSHDLKKFDILFTFGSEKSNLYSPLDHKFILTSKNNDKLYVNIIEMPEFEDEVSIPKGQNKYPVFYFVEKESEIPRVKEAKFYGLKEIYELLYKKL